MRSIEPGTHVQARFKSCGPGFRVRAFGAPRNDNAKCCAIARASRRLRHAPEERDRSLSDAGDVLAPRLVGEEEAGRRVDDVVERGLVEAAGGGLLLI